METMVHFTKTQIRAAFGGAAEADVSILDIGTGNGVLPLELASQGFAKVTGAVHTPVLPLHRQGWPAAVMMLHVADPWSEYQTMDQLQVKLQGLEDYTVVEARWPLTQHPSLAVGSGKLHSNRSKVAATNADFCAPT